MSCIRLCVIKSKPSKTFFDFMVNENSHDRNNHIRDRNLFHLDKKQNLVK